jgi:6-pyruvoyltetrahydropterin/6-carboxytetrahydropterin synthase
MTWTISKQFSFEAAHKLPAHVGKCGRLHGHSYKLTVHVSSARLIQSGSSSGMVQDFGDISQAVKPLLEAKLDHWYLNESTGLENPTSEVLAAWIYEQLAPQLAGISAIGINETCTSGCVYTPSS